jgi:hypothetical protein
LSDKFPIQNGRKQADALSPLLFRFALEYSIRNYQEKQVRQLKWETAAAGVNLIRDNINTKKRRHFFFDSTVSVVTGRLDD